MPQYITPTQPVVVYQTDTAQPTGNIPMQTPYVGNQDDPAMLSTVIAASATSDLPPSYDSILNKTQKFQESSTTHERSW